MNKRLFIAIVMFSVFVSCMFIVYNPNIATDLEDTYTQGEVFLPNNNSFDFKTFTLNSSAKNFTARHMYNGRTMMIDDTGNTTINIVEFKSMINSQKDEINNILDNELKKKSWTVDGVCVHQIDFVFYEPLYSAYYKDSASDTIIYLSSPNEKETANMINSLEFKEVNNGL